MRIEIVTGMSGAGKSSALKILEDLEYFCVDNLPLELIPKFIEILNFVETSKSKVAIGLDIRGGINLKKLNGVLEEIKKNGFQSSILFLEASDEVLIRRYKETRRVHPLAKRNGRIEDGIFKEREQLTAIKEISNYVIDTSSMQFKELNRSIQAIVVEGDHVSNMFVTILSFGYKYGTPRDADIIMDARFLPNPYYIEELREQTGQDVEVKKYVLENPVSKDFLARIKELLFFLLPNYKSEGKHQLVVGIGCTGGKHRSVALTEEIYASLRQDKQYDIYIEHRDIEK